MREIKFRAWDKTNKVFYTWGFVKEKQGLIFKGIPNLTIPMEELQSISQQFTGLKDKNTKEIYEGDIIEYKAKDCTHTAKIIIGVSEDGEYGVLIGNSILRKADKINESCEVIGNIYENPELLEVKND
jgi:hypothetical protein